VVATGKLTQLTVCRYAMENVEEEEKFIHGCMGNIF